MSFNICSTGYYGSLIRKSDNAKFVDVSLAFDSCSYSNLISLICNGPKDGNQNIILSDLFIKKADYDKYLKEELKSTSITSNINHLNYKCELVANDDSHTLLFTSLQIRFNSVPPIEITMNGEDFISLENVEANAFEYVYCN